MEERARRVGENEALFRIVNEQVATLNERFERFGEPMSAICECGRFECNERVDVPAQAYEEVRKNRRGSSSGRATSSRTSRAWSKSRTATG